MKKLILVDSCIHIEAAKTGPELLEVIFSLHPDYEFATCGMVELEVMRGIRSPGALAYAREQFNILRYLPTTRATWILAREITQALDRKGLPINTQDTVIAACAREANAAVFTYDRRFREIVGMEVLDHLAERSPKWRDPCR